MPKEEGLAKHPNRWQSLAVVIRGIAWLPLIAGLLAYLFSEGFRAEINQGVELLIAGDRDGLRELGAGMGIRAALVTSLLMIVQAIAAPIPAVLITLTNSLLFGWFWGAWLSIISATFAAWVCFEIARLLGEPVVRRLVSPRSLDRANQFLARHGAFAIIVARLLPFVPFDPISFLAGLSRMRTWTFVWATLVGQLPAGFAYSYLAHVERPEQLGWMIPTTLALLAMFGISVRYVLLRFRCTPMEHGPNSIR